MVEGAAPRPQTGHLQASDGLLATSGVGDARATDRGADGMKIGDAQVDAVRKLEGSPSPPADSRPGPGAPLVVHPRDAGNRHGVTSVSEVSRRAKMSQRVVM